MVEKEARVLLTNHRTVVMKNQSKREITFDTLFENRSILMLLFLLLEEQSGQTNGEEIKITYQYDLLPPYFSVLSTIDNFYNYRVTSLDLCKIDKSNQTLLQLRSRSVSEQNKLQDAGGKDEANESNDTTGTEKTLDNNDETTLRGEAFQ